MMAGIVALVGGVAWWVCGRLSTQDSWLTVLDRPNERSLHHTPTPRTGGVAILIGLYVGIGVLASLQLMTGKSEVSETMGWAPLGWIVALMSVLAVVSLIDDRQGLPIVLRFGVQLFAAALLVFGAHVSVPALSIPVFGTMEFGWCSAGISMALLIWMTNLYNFMDGMDGFAGGMTMIGGFSLAGLAATDQAGPVSLLALLVAGAAAGFLVHNFPPARIFMGDVGSIPIGFCFGALMLLGSREHVFDLWVPLILFSPFIADATVTLLRRALAGEKVWEAHRSHYYQRAVLLGWGHRKTVLAEYGLMLICVGLAWLYQVGDDVTRLLVLCGWSLLFLSLVAGVTIAERTAGERQLAAR